MTIVTTPEAREAAASLVSQAVDMFRASGHKMAGAFYEVGKAFGFNPRRIKSLYYRENTPPSALEITAIKRGWAQLLADEHRRAEAKAASLQRKIERLQRELDASAAEDRAALHFARAVGDGCCVDCSGDLVPWGAVAGGRYGPK